MHLTSSKARWLRRIPALVFLAVAAYTVLRSETYLAPRHADLGSLALQQLDGSAVPPGQLRGRAVLLNFWAPWCPPCREELPTLQHLHTTMPKAAIVGVEDDETQYTEGLAVARKTGLSYLLLRPTAPLRKTFGSVASLPTSLYISPSGRVVHTVTGVVPESVMRHFLQDAIDAH